jgi:hypothetical protein
MVPSGSNELRPAADEAITPEVVAEILAALRGLRYGSIVVTIHDSKVVQIEKNEKVRLQKKAGGETR